MNKRQRIVLFSTLYFADEKKVPRDLVINLEEQIKDEIVTPDLLMSKCLFIWDNIDPKMHSDDWKFDAIEELQHALTKACTYPKIMVEKAMKMKGIIRGWKISRGHHYRKINQRCKAAGIKLRKQ
jgi:hypothetical protein